MVVFEVKGSPRAETLRKHWSRELKAEQITNVHFYILAHGKLDQFGCSEIQTPENIQGLATKQINTSFSISIRCDQEKENNFHLTLFCGMISHTLYGRHTTTDLN
jgi:hypothetical protein